jgi:poly-gamma-glutamate capsule biosynthesis protein CapA/YwtB (metallophosphatase superfamily)
MRPSAERRRLPAQVLAGLAVLAVTAGWGARSHPLAQVAPARQAAVRAQADPVDDGTMSVALTGDSIITRKLSVYHEPAFLELMELIRGADAAYTNLEMLFHDYEPYAMTESGGTYMRADPALAGELVWAGFDLVARANNHAGDYGVLGMQLTTGYVAKAGLVQAGVGASLAEAREARFLDTARGRVALVSTASTFTDFSRAGRSRGDMPARPGLNPLRVTRTYVLPRDQFDALRGVVKELGMRGGGSGDTLSAFGARFVVGEKADVRTTLLDEDLREIAAVVKNASRMADHTIVAFHSHESDGQRTAPPRFLVTFCHAMIDAGADMLVGSGPHVLRGIEIYKGKPIFYSLGDFIFENETLLRLPSENYEPYGLGADAHVADFNDRRYSNDTRSFPADREIWESVVAVPRWKGGTLVDLTLHPITLQFGQGRTVRGRPLLAAGDLAGKIIGDVIERSKPLGATVVFENGVGKVILPASAAGTASR